MTTDQTDDEMINQVIERLTERFPKAKPKEIDEIVREEFHEIAGRPVRDYLSVLTERAAKKRLKK